MNTAVMTRRRVIRSARAVGATPETASKLEADPLETLLRTSWAHLSGEMETLNRQAAERAAGEIGAIYKAIIHDVVASQMKWTRRYAGRYEIPDGLAALHARRFRPWALRTGPEVVDLTLRIVVDRTDIGQSHYPRVAVALLNYARRMRQK